MARSRAGTGSLAQAIMDEGLTASSELLLPGPRTGAQGETNEARKLAERHHMPYVDLSTGVQKDAAESIPTHVLDRAGAIPYQLEGERPQGRDRRPERHHRDRRAAARHALHARDRGRAPRGHRPRARRSCAPARPGSARRSSRTSSRSTRTETEDDLEADDGVSDAPLVRLVNSIILQAAEDGASDLHFDPQDDALVVRLRVDGVLHEVQRIPKRLAVAVTTRLKVLAKLDIAERRKPQDGRISLNAKAAGRLLDIRVAVLPTVEGESVVMRLLDKSKRPPTLSELGLSDEMRDALEEIVVKPTGALLVTGPTGSGKSTTLYAALTRSTAPRSTSSPSRIRSSTGSPGQPGAGQPEGGHDLLGGAALDPALRPGRRDGRGDPRRRDGQDGDRGGAHGPLRPLDPAHERRAERAHPAERDGRRAVPDRLRRHRRARAAPRPEALHPLLRDVHGHPRGDAPGALHAGAGRRRRRCLPLPQARLPTLQPDGLQGPDRHLPADGHDRGAKPARRAAREP